MREAKGKIKITINIDRELYKSLTEELIRIGIHNYYSESGRSVVIEEKRGAAGYITKEKLVSYPVVTIFFFIENEYSENLMNHIAGKYDFSTPGKGTIFSSNINLLAAHPFYDSPPELDTSLLYGNAYLFEELEGLCCIVQRGLGDNIAWTCLESGIGAPQITFGLGGGRRDTLGLLRIAIPAEKEIIDIVTSKYDIHAVMEMIIEKGKMDEPGKGFIYQYSVRHGIVNTKIKQGKSGQVASMEQIISAIDSIKGNLQWRKSRLESVEYKRRFFMNDFTELCLICNSGYGADLMKKAITKGSTGATISKVNYNSETEEEEEISYGREVCRMIVPKDRVSGITETIEESGAFSNEIYGLLYTRAAPKTFTYRR